MSPIRSSHVLDLLSDIEQRQRATRLAMIALTAEAIRRHAGAYSTFKTSKGWNFVFTRDQVAAFLVDTRIEQWGRSVWIRFDRDCRDLKADIGLNHGIRQTQEVLNHICDSALMQLHTDRAILVNKIGGTSYYGFSAPALVDLLESAHHISKTTPGWIDPPAVTRGSRPSF